MAIIKQNYLCVDLQTRTQSTPMETGEGRLGVLTMTCENEKFLFDEVLPESYTPNPKVFKGTILNVHKDKQGLYQVHFRRMLLTKQMSPKRIANIIATELLTAKKILGL